MRLVTLSVRDFRSYTSAAIAFGDGVTVISGPNGAGKTNLLEALYFACTGRSCRTTNEREVVRFGASVTRVELEAEDEAGPHELSVAFEPGQPKRMKVDGALVEGLLGSPHRPLVSVFLPDRLELVKGAPGLRRAHLDQVVAALWPARVTTRRTYAQALAQRNALIARIRAGHAVQEQLVGWDLQLARQAIALMHDRAAALEHLQAPFARMAELLGLAPAGELDLVYRPRSRASDAGAFADELAQRLESDLARGFTDHGPHRDEILIRRGGRELRAYGSQGQQRLSLLALLLAERIAIGERRDALPVILLDDVLSELDRERRERLLELLRASGGQSLITTTELDHVPGAADEDIVKVTVAGGQVLAQAVAA